MRKSTIWLLALSLGMSGAVLAQGGVSEAEQQKPLSGDTSQETGAVDQPEAEPQVTIVQKGADRVEEYRLNGQLYMVKITPKKGPPYYLIDVDGDGNLETRRNDLMPGSVPTWVLFRW